MSKGIYDLGSGLGWIYVVKPDKSTIVEPLRNTPENARKVKLKAVEAMSVALNRKANGTVTIASVTGVGTIAEIIINGVHQIDVASPIAFTGATSTSDLATLINTAVNSYGGGADATYTSIVSGDTITFIAPESIGANDNGQSITVVISANATYTSTAVNNGSDASELYDLGYGYTFFLDADYATTGCSGTGTAVPTSLTNAVEITDYIIQRGLNSAIDIQSKTISGGVIVFTRKSVDTLIYIDTESSAGTDDLTTINPSGFANGDKITFRGENSGRVVTFQDYTVVVSGNIVLQGAVSFSTADTATAITLQLKDSKWYEVSRTTQSIGSTANYRTAGFGFFGIDTFSTQAVVSAASVTYNGGTDSKYQEITGSVTLGANSTYALGTGVAGDEFILKYNASTTTGANTLSIFGVTLTSAQALNGGLIFYAKYESAAWRVSVMPNLDSAIAYPYVIPTELYKALSVTVAKVEATLSTEVIVLPISWDPNRTGDHKIVLPYPCTVVQIDVYADDLIEATDDADVNFKNNAGLSMGTLTFSGGDTIGTGYSSTPSSNNTFTAGQVLTATTTKTTKGGNAKASIKITKS